MGACTTISGWKQHGSGTRQFSLATPAGKTQAEGEPHRDLARHSYRVFDLVDNQVRSLRKRQLIDGYKAKETDAAHRKGAYWGIRTNIKEYGLPDALDCPFDRTTTLAETPTRLKRLDDRLQEQLINWGYAVCDAALRRHVDPAISKPSGFPYSGVGVSAIPIEIPSPLVEFILLGPADDRRQLQTCPSSAIYAIEFGREPAGRHDLLISPFRLGTRARSPRK